MFFFRAKSKAASKSTEDGFEFTAKKKVSKKSAASDASSSASAAAASASAAASAAPVAAAPSVASLAAPAYPSQQASKKFAFDSTVPLPAGVTKLCADVFASEQSLLVQTFSSSSKHKSASKGQVAFLVPACAAMAQEVLQNMPTRLAEHLATSAGRADGPTILEHPTNVAARDAIEKWTRLTRQAELDTEVFRRERIQRQQQQQQAGGTPATKALPIDASVISDEGKAFLKAHPGGLLSQAIDHAFASTAIKGEATLRRLQEIQRTVTTVRGDQRAIAVKINAEEKKAYGAAVDDPKSLIAMMTSAETTPAAPAPAAAAMEQ